MLIRVMYQDYRYDYVDVAALDRLIATNHIAKFLRPSEGRWVILDRDAIRGWGGPYSGAERRRPQPAV